MGSRQENNKEIRNSCSQARDCWRSGGVALLGWSGKASLSRRIREEGGGGGITPPIMHYTCRSPLP